MLLLFRFIFYRTFHSISSSLSVCYIATISQLWIRNDNFLENGIVGSVPIRTSFPRDRFHQSRVYYHWRSEINEHPLMARGQTRFVQFPGSSFPRIREVPAGHANDLIACPRRWIESTDQRSSNASRDRVPSDLPFIRYFGSPSDAFFGFAAAGSCNGLGVYRARRSRLIDRELRANRLSIVKPPSRHHCRPVDPRYCTPDAILESSSITGVIDPLKNSIKSLISSSN